MAAAQAAENHGDECELADIYDDNNISNNFFIFFL